MPCHCVVQGVPVRVELGPRDMEKGEFVAVRRDTSAKMILKIDTAVDCVTQLLDDIHDNMYKKYDVIVTLPFLFSGWFCGKRQKESNPPSWEWSFLFQ